MKPSRSQLLKRLPTLFEIPAPDPARARRRIEVMERNIMLPVNAVFIALILHSFNYHSKWMSSLSNNLDVTVETVQLLSVFYVLLAVALALPVLAVRRLPLAVLQWSVVTSSLIDGLMLAGTTIITGALDSVLFWLFIGLILRNAVSVPPGFSQLFLNFAISLCYSLVAVIEAAVMSPLEETTQRALDMTPSEELGELFFLRMLVLWLVAVSYTHLR